VYTLPHLLTVVARSRRQSGCDRVYLASLSAAQRNPAIKPFYD
jgi:hypothetical protein